MHFSIALEGQFPAVLNNDGPSLLKQENYTSGGGVMILMINAQFSILFWRHNVFKV